MPLVAGLRRVCGKRFEPTALVTLCDRSNYCVPNVRVIGSSPIRSPKVHSIAECALRTGSSAAERGIISVKYADNESSTVIGISSG